MYSPPSQLQDVMSMHGSTIVLRQHPVISSCWGGQTKYEILSHILNTIPANILQAAAAVAAAATTNIFDSFRKYKSGIMCKY